MAGYYLTPRKLNQIAPKMMITMLQTTAKTGLFILSSDKFMQE